MFEDVLTLTSLNSILQNLNSGFELWNPGALPPSLIAFEGHVHRIDASWHIAGLGYRSIIDVTQSALEDGAVVHFSGPAKPWLEIGAPEIRSLWSRHVNMSSEFIRKCGIMEWTIKGTKSHSQREMYQNLASIYILSWREEGTAFSLQSDHTVVSLYRREASMPYTTQTRYCLTIFEMQ